MKGLDNPMKKYRRNTISTAFLWIAALCLSAGPGACVGGQSADPPGLTLLSFNIRYDNPRDGGNGWPHRKELVAGTVLFHKGDLVGMQEALHHQVHDLASLLPGYGWIGAGRDDGKEGGEFSPIFYRRTRLAPLAHSTFWLSETPEVPGSRGWDAALPRIVTWARFRDLRSGREFFAFNTHFDHRGGEARRESAALLLRKSRDIAGENPLAVTGDFNCSPDSEPYRIMTEGIGGIRGLDDTWFLADNPYGGTQTFNGFSGEVRPGQRIDYIFIGGGFRVRRFGVIAERWDGRFTSDHFPVLTEILPGQ